MVKVSHGHLSSLFNFPMNQYLKFRTRDRVDGINEAKNVFLEGSQLLSLFDKGLPKDASSKGNIEAFNRAKHFRHFKVLRAVIVQEEAGKLLLGKCLQESSTKTFCFN